MTVRHVLAFLAATLAVGVTPAAAQTAPTDVVGGTEIPITQAYFTVALVDHTAPNGANLYAYCAGALLDAVHVLTSADCTYDDLDALIDSDPASIDVVAGTADLRLLPGTGQRIQVESFERHPDWNPATLASDVAVLTLTQRLDLTQTTVSPGHLGGYVLPGDAMNVTGFGVTSEAAPLPSQTLIRTDVPIVDTADCDTAYAGSGGIDTATMICAGSTGHDGCFGDYGAPLTYPGASGIAGVYIGGVGCGRAGLPGIYASVLTQSIRDFIAVAAAPPEQLTVATLVGDPVVGQTLTCNPGEWTGKPRFSFQFLAVSTSTQPGANPTELTGWTTNDKLFLDRGHQGRRVYCLVSDSGSSTHRSINTTPPVAAAPVVIPPPAPKADTTKPVSKVGSTRCTLSTCRIVVDVADAGYSTGVKEIEVAYSVKYRVKCTRKHRKTTCPKTKRVTTKFNPSAGGPSHFVVKLTKLHASATVTTRITAVDKTGNREAVAVVNVMKTSKAGKKG